MAFSVPAFTALLKLGMLGVNFNPTLVVSDVGSDAITLSGLLESFAKQGGKTVNGNQLTNGIITDGYLPALGTASSNTWLQLFSKIHAQYISKLPFDGNVEYGMSAAYTFVQAMFKAGKNPTRQDLLNAINKRPVPGRVGGADGLLADEPQRRDRRLHGHASRTASWSSRVRCSSPTPRLAARSRRTRLPQPRGAGFRYP